MGSPYRTLTVADPYSPAWTRFRRLLIVCAASGALALGFIVVSAVTASYLVIALVVGAFFVHRVAASWAIETACPHCKQRFLRERVSMFGGGAPLLVLTPLSLFGRIACQGCRIPLGTSKADAPGIVAAAAAARTHIEATTWQCGCGIRNDRTQQKCTRCLGIKSLA
jgi:hypothetical protein